MVGGADFSQDSFKLNLVERTEGWLGKAALPLWAGAGFDSRAGLFEESLDFDHKPSKAPRRLMVQSRQISVYAAAHLSGRFAEGGELALRAMRQTISRYLEADGAPGWVFSLSRMGEPLDNRRDLYAHAFALFALAWALRLEDDPRFHMAVDKTITILEKSFTDPRHGGYWDCLPRPDALRRQNPHMHLFEALIALHQSSGREDALVLASKLNMLARQSFINPLTGALREYFDESWRVHPAPGQGSVEPGHLFEWAWLFQRYEEISGILPDATVGALIAFALEHGFDRATGRVFDEVGESGMPRAATGRCWPHCEALKALCGERARGTDHGQSIAAIGQRLLDQFCRPDLGGGWIDRVDESDNPVSQMMPASTFYHIYFGLDALNNAEPVERSHLS